MKKLAFLILSLICIQTAIAQNTKLAPFFKIGTSDESISALSTTIKSNLESNGFKIIGEYNPEANPNLGVVCFTRKDLQKLCLKSADRGALASVLKIGLVKKDGKTSISILNPDYMFCAYLSNYETEKNAYSKITADLKMALESYGKDYEPFGGEVKTDALKKYHYKMMMPYFDDPVELNEFNSFEEGLLIIRKNLEAKKGNTELIYEQVFTDQKIAVFGIGLLDKEDGEKDFLPIIGEDHIAAMPYEIILQGKEASILHGKYRFALYWPELTMGTFMKIMSTPGDVEDFMEALTE
ncbi:hypothetical protein [Ancylomarina longa]|uniref:DUF302 domain-containing protein n=1 Tax=Ancylomarina longa TaxID=2487017 RepID=A0A434AVW7_9BACT|nr:hypothetical protein [Ancylomarina longa]RUT78611.1 hypothetical protein DLK05_07160 [Ancylomarina longa]